MRAVQRSLFNRGVPGDSGREENFAGFWNYAGRQVFRLPGGCHTGDPGVWAKSFSVKSGEDFSLSLSTPDVGGKNSGENEKRVESAGTDSGDIAARAEINKEVTEEKEEMKNEKPPSPRPMKKERGRPLVWKEFPK